MQNIKKYKDVLLPVIFVISFGISFVDELFNDYKPQYLILIFWICIAILKFIRYKDFYSIQFCKISFYLLLPKIVIYVYSFMLFLFGISNSEYFSTNITVIVPTLGIISCLYLFKENTLKYVLCSFIVAFVILWIYKIYSYGFIDCLQAFYKNQFITGNVAEWSPFEVHDLTFAAGYLLIFLLFIFDKKSIFNNILLIISIILMYLGYKRIQFLAIIAVIIVFILFKILDKKYRRKICYGILFLIGISATIYLFSILTGVFFKIINFIGVDTMGRIYYYNFIKDVCFIDISFLGYGANFVTHYMLDVYGYLGVGGVHNDILKMYAELGFVLFFSWLIYYLGLLPYKVEKIFNKNILSLFVLISTYTFVIYTTDNIENYYISSFFYLFIPVWYGLYYKNNIKLYENFDNKIKKLLKKGRNKHEIK